MNSNGSDYEKYVKLSPNSSTSHFLEQSVFSSAMVTDLLSDDEEDKVRPRDNPKNELLWAAEHGHLDLVKKLITSDRSLLNATDQDGYTVLHRATYNRHINVVKWLLNEGADINARTIDNWTPLHSACYWNNVECVDLFLSLGVDINARSKGNVTPLHLATAKAEGRHVLELLLSDPNIDIDIKNDGNETALEIAKRVGNNAGLFEMAETCFREFPLKT